MKRLLPLIILLLGTVVAASANTLDDYLKHRKKYAITQAVGVETLETLIGTRVVEVQGIVKGVISVGDKGQLLLERSDGDFVYVSCGQPPQWLTSNATPVRLIVQAERKVEYGELKTSLIAAAPEGPIAELEAEVKRKAAAAAAPKKKGTRSTTSLPSRGGGREWNLPASEATPIYAGFIKKRNSRLSDGEAYKIAQGIIGFSLQYGVDARLIMAMVLVESGFNPRAVSHAGAIGLGQLMPGTARGMGVNPHNAMENLYASVKIIRGHINNYKKKTGDDYEALVLALAAYNAGSGAVRRHGGVPPYKETQNHIRKVISVYQELCGG